LEHYCSLAFGTSLLNIHT